MMKSIINPTENTIPYVIHDSLISAPHRTFDAFNAQYYIMDSSIQNMKGVVSKTSIRPLDPIIIRPYFTVLDWAKARPIMAEFIQRTSKETGMIYYGWDISGDKLYCREAYRDADAALVHLDNVGSSITDLLAEGVAKMDSISIHGPAAELEKLKPSTESFGACVSVCVGWCVSACVA